MKWCAIINPNDAGGLSLENLEVENWTLLAN